MANDKSSKTHGTRWAFLGVIALVLVIANLGVLGYMTGYFKPREKIAMVTWNQDPYWDLVVEGAKDAAKEMNADLTVVESAPDEKVQSQHVRDLLSAGMQGIAISPNNPETQADLLKEVARKAVLVTFDSDAPKSNRIAFVGTDNYNAGQVCADQVRAAIPSGGEVIISLGSLDLLNGRERRQGLIDDLIDRHGNPDRAADPLNAVLKGPKYTIAATVLDKGDTARAISLMTDAIKAHPNVKCIAGLFSYSAPAAVKAIKASGKTGQIKVIAFDELDATQAGVEAGTIYSSILQDQYRCGHETVVALLNALRGVNQSGPSGARIIPTRIMVMKAANIADLRTDKLIHQPAK